MSVCDDRLESIEVFSDCEDVRVEDGGVMNIQKNMKNFSNKILDRLLDFESLSTKHRKLYHTFRWLLTTSYAASVDHLNNMKESLDKLYNIIVEYSDDEGKDVSTGEDTRDRDRYYSMIRMHLDVLYDTYINGYKGILKDNK